MTGKARYTLDVAIDGLLHMKLLRSPHAHARIVSIDKSAALAVPGVRAVLTYEDAPPIAVLDARGTRTDAIDPDDTRVLDDVVRFVGQRVAAVVADSEGRGGGRLPAAQGRLRNPAGGVRSRSRRCARARRSSTTRAPKRASSMPQRNIVAEIHGDIGDVAAGFAAADVIHEGTYHHPARPARASGDALRPSRWIDADGVLNVRSSTQVPFLTRRALCATSSTSMPDKVRVFCERVGGGFGGKQEMLVEDIVALAALKTGRPVKLEFTREEQFIATTTRHPMRVHDQGRRRARRHAHRDADATSSPTPAPTAITAARCCTTPAARCIGVYRCANKKVDGYRRLHQHGAGRRLSAATACRRRSFAVEVGDRRVGARSIGMDPIEFRRRNVVRAGRSRCCRRPTSECTT